MIQAYILLIGAEPMCIQDLVKELAHTELDGSVIKSVRTTTGQFDLITFVESPDLPSLDN